MAAAEMRLDRQVAPVVELLYQRGARRRRLQAERVATQVGLYAVVVARQQEFGAERRQRVGRVAGQAFGLEDIHGRRAA